MTPSPEPTLLELLSEAAAVCEGIALYPNGVWDVGACEIRAQRLRAAEARVRGIFNDPRMVLAFEAPAIRVDVFERINGGPLAAHPDEAGR